MYPSAPSLPSFVTSERQPSSNGGHMFAGFSNVSQSHDSKQRVPGGYHGGRPPLGDRSSPTVGAGERWNPIPFSDLGVDRKFSLTSANHDRKSVI